ncbi:MAG: AAA family ATPase, partial [Gammaproteobacteria bacterium]|nr:AAA family ATPase [Gammaproteobacteria bacterium]
NLLLGLGIQRPGVELLQLFEWVRQEGVTTLVTTSGSETGRGSLILDEYAVDCVIQLSQHLDQQLMTRYLRVVKMRGSSHGTNAYPFSLNDHGIALLPITSTRLDKEASQERISTGIREMDQMLGAAGYFKGSTLMFSGRSGSGKTILLATLLEEALRQGRRGLFLSFEESPSELQRNLLSVGIDLQPYLKQGVLALESRRAVEMGLEEHLITTLQQLEQGEYDLLILDPVTALIDMGDTNQVKMLLIRFFSYLKSLGVTIVLSELLPDYSGDYSNLAISSLIDAWFRLRQVENSGEFNRTINLIKARGSSTSNQIKEFRLTSKGVVIEEPYIGDGTMVFGAAKSVAEARDREVEEENAHQREQLRQSLLTLEATHQAHLKVKEAEFTQQHRLLERELELLRQQENRLQQRRTEMQQRRS